ncbi:MAG: DNA sulfur modification protein DndB [Pleurocapsa sp. MO_226.B13]|nr:DNA sulfur modification protein DndB [Pleurocapsa sp. MO_226.B13]
MEINQLTIYSDLNASTSDSVSHNPDLAKQFQAVIEKHILESYGKAQCYPALIFYQGKRKMVQINVPAIEVPALLKAKPSNDNDPDSGKNRPLDIKHADEIKEYIFHRADANKPWILGTLTANVSKEKIDIVPIWGNICLVKIPRGVFLEITDGQHRTRAMQQLIMSEGDERDLISNDSFAITLVLEDDLRQCQTDFRDMAQTKTLPPALLVSYGGLGRDGIAQILVDKFPMFKNKTQKIKTSPGSGSKFVYTSNYVAKAVGCAFTNNPNNELLDYEVEESAELLNKYFNIFFSECSHTKQIFLQEELKPDEATKFKETCLLGMSVGLEILGRLMNSCYDKQNHSFEESKIIELTQLDWSKESELWRNNVVRLDHNPKDPNKPFKISASATNVSIAVKQAKEKLGWTTL